MVLSKKCGSVLNVLKVTTKFPIYVSFDVTFVGPIGRRKHAVLVNAFSPAKYMHKDNSKQ